MVTLLLTCYVPEVLSWGFWAHKRINRMAVFTMPPDLIGFYKSHIDYITENAVNPDKRRYAVPDEAARHYIDIDHYGEHPFDSVPRNWKDAVAKYSEDTLKAYGIVPWHILIMKYRLTEAFQKKDLSRILFLSADIGHYLGDAHVPLHCTKNYNGQLTNQKGIHGFWESRIPELYGEDYDCLVGTAEYIEDPLDYIWKIIEGSANAVDSVLDFERELNTEFPTDRKYAIENRGSVTMQVYSRDYCIAYNTKLDGMIERRYRQSIKAIGSFWYTCWVDAGQPDVSDLKKYEMTAEEKEKEKELDQIWKTGKAPEKGHSD
ncbi:MAG: S1/P1 Nuclease [Bacteroidia bacterium]|nr:S1/P1 Nuclease [Bacteroidia bacterium]